MAGEEDRPPRPRSCVCRGGNCLCRWQVCGGVFDDQITDAAKAYLAAASSIDDIPVAEAVLLLKTFDDGRGVLAEDITEAAVAAFIAAPCCRFQPGNCVRIFSGDIKTHLLAFLSAKADADDVAMLRRTRARCCSSPSTPTRTTIRGSSSSSVSQSLSCPRRSRVRRRSCRRGRLVEACLDAEEELCFYESSTPRRRTATLTPRQRTATLTPMWRTATTSR